MKKEDEERLSEIEKLVRDAWIGSEIPRRRLLEVEGRLARLPLRIVHRTFMGNARPFSFLCFDSKVGHFFVIVEDADSNEVERFSLTNVGEASDDWVITAEGWLDTFLSDLLTDLREDGVK